MEDIRALDRYGEERTYMFNVYSESRDLDRYPDPQEYGIHFDRPFKNVVGFEVIEALLPRSQYLIDEHNRTLVLFVGEVRHRIDVAVGEYTYETLLDALNASLLPLGVRASFQDRGRNVIEFTSNRFFRIDVLDSPLARFLGFEMSNEYRNRNTQIGPTIPSADDEDLQEIVSASFPEPEEGPIDFKDQYDPHHGFVASLRLNGSTNTVDRYRFPLFSPVLRTPAVDVFVGPRSVRTRARVRYDSEKQFPEETVFPTVGVMGENAEVMRSMTDAWTFWNTLENHQSENNMGAFAATEGLDTSELFEEDGGLRLGYATVAGSLRTSGARENWQETGSISQHTLLFRFRWHDTLGTLPVFRYGDDETYLGIEVSNGQARYVRAETKWGAQTVQARLRTVIGASDPGIVGADIVPTRETLIYEIAADTNSLDLAKDQPVTIKDANDVEWSAKVVEEGNVTRIQIEDNDEPPFLGAEFPLHIGETELKMMTEATYQTHEWRESFRRVDEPDAELQLGTMGVARVGATWAPAVVTGTQDGKTHVHLAVQNAVWNPLDVGNPVEFRYGGKVFRLTEPTVENNALQRGEVRDVYVEEDPDIASVETPTEITDNEGRTGVLMRVVSIPGGILRLEAVWRAVDPDTTVGSATSENPSVSFASFSEVELVDGPNASTLFAQPIGVDLEGPAYVLHRDVPSEIDGVRLQSSSATLDASLVERVENVGLDPFDGGDVDRIDWSARVFERDPLIDAYKENGWAGLSANVFFETTQEIAVTRTNVLAPRLEDGETYWGTIRVRTDGVDVRLVHTNPGAEMSTFSVADRIGVRGTVRPDGRLDGEVKGLQNAKWIVPYSSRMYQNVGTKTPVLLELAAYNEGVDFETHPTLVNTGVVWRNFTFTAPEEYVWRGFVVYGEDLSEDPTSLFSDEMNAMIEVSAGRIIAYFNELPNDGENLEIEVDFNELENVANFHRIVAFGHPKSEWDGYIEHTFDNLEPQIPHAVGFDPRGSVFLRNGKTDETTARDLDWTSFLEDTDSSRVEPESGGYTYQLRDLLFADPAYIATNLDALYRYRPKTFWVYSEPDDPQGMVKRFDLFPRETIYNIRTVSEVSQRFLIDGMTEPGYLKCLTLFFSGTDFLDAKYPLRIRILDYKGETIDELVELFDETNLSSRISTQSSTDRPCAEFPTSIPNLSSLTIHYDRYRTSSRVYLEAGLPYTVTVAFSFPDMPDVAFRLPVFETADRFQGTARILQEGSPSREISGFVPLHIETENVTQRITSPGITMLTPGSFVKLSVPELEDYMFTKQNYDARTTGVASFFFSEELAHQYFRFDYGALQYQPSQPIARISGLTFRFLREDDTLYNFRGVNHVMKVLVRFLAPKTDHDFPSEMAPHYDATRVVYADGREDDDDETAIRPYVPDR